MQRDADIWATAACPGTALVHDRFASNEDRLILIGFSQRPAAESQVVHEEWANYIHSHFVVTASQGTAFMVRENQYAGDRPARSRTIELGLCDFSVRKVGPWEEDAED